MGTIKYHKKFPMLREVHHPVIQYKLSRLREPSTNRKLFKELTEELALLLGYEAMRDFPMRTRKVKTPLEVFEGPCLAYNKFVIVPILRAGLGMADGLMKLLPMASIGHIGIFRNEETLEAVNYYFKLPSGCEDAHFFVCDPMLATGGTATATLAKLKERGISKIIFISLVAAPEGVARTMEAHPDVPIFIANLDRQLNEKGYILPGLGDAGDRLWAVR
jgi:uracil phosphoribosyltransferase